MSGANCSSEAWWPESLADFFFLYFIHVFIYLYHLILYPILSYIFLVVIVVVVFFPFDFFLVEFSIETTKCGEAAKSPSAFAWHDHVTRLESVSLAVFVSLFVDPELITMVMACKLDTDLLGNSSANGSNGNLPQAATDAVGCRRFFLGSLCKAMAVFSAC